MSTFKAIILKNKAHVKRDGTSNIKIRITHNRKADYIATDLYVGVNNINNSGIVINGPNKEFLNFRISALINKYQQHDILLGDRRNFMTVQQIKKHLLHGITNSNEIDFFEFCESYMKTVTVPGTLEQYSFCIKSLKSFVGNQLPVNEITYNFLIKYENFLRLRNVRNGIINYMRTFRALFNKCRDHYNDEDSAVVIIPHYPFKKYKLPKRTTEALDHVLSVQELRKLVSYCPANDGELFAKDMFLLMFLLIGIEAKDLFYCEKPKKGRVNYLRFKTGRKYSIFLEPEALEIVNRYLDDDLLLNVSKRFELPKTFLRSVNNYLSGNPYKNITGIFSKLGIRADVTSKWSRHSWATIARNDCRIDKDDVALCLGHQDIDNRVTDMYIKYDNSIIDNSNRKVIDKVYST